jgi:transposase
VPDVSSHAPADVRLWVALDVHKLSIVAATLPPAGGQPEVQRIETTERAIRRLIGRLGGADGLAVAYEAGPGGFDLLRLLSRIGVRCDVIAPSLVPVRAGDRVKTDRRDATKLVRLYRAGELSFVAAPDQQTEGLRDLMRCRDDLRCAERRRVTASPSSCCVTAGSIATAARSGPSATSRGCIASAWTTPLAHAALEQMLCHLEGLDRQLARLDGDIEQVAASGPWREQVAALTAFRGISTRTALGLIAEIGDFRRFAHPRELASWLGITPTEYSSGDQQHRGHITKTGNRHARRLLIETAWHYRHRPRHPTTGRPRSDRAWHAEVRLHRRHHDLIQRGKRSTIVNVAIARELAAFLWAEMTCQPHHRKATA